MNDDQIGVILTPEQVAELLGCTTEWLAQLRYRGDGPRFLKLGRLVRYRDRDLNAWLSGSVRERT
jgi:predicted DNA-binding transcriptional regulator AlpA